MHVVRFGWSAVDLSRHACYLSLNMCAQIIIVITFLSLALFFFVCTILMNVCVLWREFQIAVDLRPSARSVFARAVSRECASVRVCACSVCALRDLHIRYISSVFTPKKQIAQFPSISLFFCSRVIFHLAPLFNCYMREHSFLSRALDLFFPFACCYLYFVVVVVIANILVLWFSISFLFHLTPVNSNWIYDLKLIFFPRLPQAFFRTKNKK